MNRNSSADGPGRFMHIPFKDHAISWAGPHPFRSGFCFGTEEGWLLFTDEQGTEISEPFKVTSQEAITGMACIQRWLTVSTREAVTFWKLPTPGEKPDAVIFPHGAHGVIATAGGTFLAPLGQTGIMSIRPPLDAKKSATVTGSKGEREGLAFYRVASLQSGNGSEVIACAARFGGLGATELRWDRESQTFTTASFPGLDVVDVCAIGSDAGSLAVAAVGRDGTVILSQDALRDKKPITLKFQTVQGTAYRLLSHRGDLFLLTSKALYMLAKVADRFVSGQLAERTTTPIMVMPVEAVDAGLCFERWLLVIMPDGVRRFDATLMHESTPECIRNGDFEESQAQFLSPAWEWQDIAHGRQLTTVAG